MVFAKHSGGQGAAPPKMNDKQTVAFSVSRGRQLCLYHRLWVARPRFGASLWPRGGGLRRKTQRTKNAGLLADP